jgi:6-pyruvoyltetrahydropterin/6-carboxytetrahydropterin synthase
LKAYLTKRYWFSAAHRLQNDALSADENRRLYGKCNNNYGHGHNYTLEVTVSGKVDPSTGMVCDLRVLDHTVQQEVLARFDHENLNMLPDFAGRVPTSEVLAERIYELLHRSFHAAYLEKIRLEETSQNSFEYAGGREIWR